MDEHPLDQEEEVKEQVVHLEVVLSHDFALPLDLIDLCLPLQPPLHVGLFHHVLNH